MTICEAALVLYFSFFVYTLGTASQSSITTLKSCRQRSYSILHDNSGNNVKSLAIK